MSGIIMWVVLGGLIGVVMIFLIVTSLLDKKKNKKIKEEKRRLAADIKVAGKNVSDRIMEVVTTNDEALKSFKPSIGKVKMSDINQDAKNKLIKIRKSRDFKLIKHLDQEHKLFSTKLDAMIKEKSNNWRRRNVEDIKFFKTYEIKEEKKPEVKSKKKRGK